MSQLNVKIIVQDKRIVIIPDDPDRNFANLSRELKKGYVISTPEENNRLKSLKIGFKEGNETELENESESDEPEDEVTLIKMTLKLFYLF